MLPMTGDWSPGRNLIGAVALAIADINADPGILGGKRLSFAPVRDDGCDRWKALGACSDMIEEDGPIIGLIGPGCSGGCESTAALSVAKNLPQISPFCGSPTLSDKKNFPNFVRTTSPYSKWASAIVALMRWAQWTCISVIRDQSAIMALSAASLQSSMTGSGLTVAIDVEFVADQFQPSALDRIRAAGAHIVMVFAYPSDYVAIALAARASKMTVGWAWVGIDMVADAVLLAKKHGQRDAQEAMQGWLYLEPHSAANGSFFDRVRRASTDTLGLEMAQDATVHAFAANLYDALFLFARAAGRHPELLLNGRGMVEAMKNLTFDGVTGHVQLDSDGDLVETIRIASCIFRDSELRSSQRVAVYNRLSRQLTWEISEVVWPGQTTVRPFGNPLADETNQLSTRYQVSQVCVRLFESVRPLYRRADYHSCGPCLHHACALCHCGLLHGQNERQRCCMKC